MLITSIVCYSFNTSNALYCISCYIISTFKYNERYSKYMIEMWESNILESNRYESKGIKKTSPFGSV